MSTDAERFKNAMQVPYTPAGNGLGVGRKVEYFDRDISLIVGIAQNFEQGRKLQVAEPGPAAVGIIDMDMF